jgi:hypothetical protein
MIVKRHSDQSAAVTLIFRGSASDHDSRDPVTKPGQKKQFDDYNNRLAQERAGAIAHAVVGIVDQVGRNAALLVRVEIMPKDAYAVNNSGTIIEDRRVEVWLKSSSATLAEQLRQEFASVPTSMP